ncbi:hypothetical protein C4552_03920 [Candidatus Parcubacteria bacterium]|nr:MAG: hypothetical protein C4552_03920 [Candidatus Parcubacteria bacterium]
MPTKFRIVFFTVAALGLIAASAEADHAWGTYHWARTANPFTLQLGDNLSSQWDSYLATASSDWSQSGVLDTIIAAGRSSPRTCRPTAGRVEICNSRYGRNGWLGIASVWVNASGHITQGAVRMNDTYFSTVQYNTPAWRNLVLCQEIGHTFGLAHQDENFSNAPLGSCMDYSSNPTPNQHPNQHDYDQLELIYNHADTTTTLRSTAAALRARVDVPALANLATLNLAREEDETAAEWGERIQHSARERTSVYKKDAGRGETVFTFVIWADETADGHEHDH